MQLRPGIAGVLIIHSRAIRQVEPGGEELIIRPGLAWLEYRNQLTTTTIAWNGDRVFRDEELGLCGEATRAKELTLVQEGTLFRAVAQRADTERRRGLCSCDSNLSPAKFAALIWRVVTGDRLRSRLGVFNESALADAIEGANRSERFGFAYVRDDIDRESEYEEEDEQQRSH